MRWWGISYPYPKLGITCIALLSAGEADRECCMRTKKEYGNTIKRFKQTGIPG